MKEKIKKFVDENPNVVALLATVSAACAFSIGWKYGIKTGKKLSNLETGAALAQLCEAKSSIEVPANGMKYVISGTVKSLKD